MGVQWTLTGLKRVTVRVVIPATGPPLPHSLFPPLLLSYQLGGPPGSVVHAGN